MNLCTRLSRSEGYRLLGMYGESILILEDIPPGKERWDSLVVEARYNTYLDAKEWEMDKYPQCIPSWKSEIINQNYFRVFRTFCILGY